MKKEQIINNFTVLEVKRLENLKADGILLEHNITKTRVFHIHNEDKENYFSYIFKTIPLNSKGAPHILEHMVFSGTEKYKCKDLIAILIAKSLSTTLNASTYADKTQYYAASFVKKDLFNLMEVYGDMVFNPDLDLNAFNQEGWRYISKDKGFDITGIVFNEMKASVSNASSILHEGIEQSLFDKNVTYHHNSGGDPLDIIDLSHKEIVEFHNKFYHPSNAKIFLYGNISTEDYTKFLNDRFLSKFSYQPVKYDIAFQDKREKTNELEFAYPFDSSDTKNNTMINISWLLKDSLDLIKNFSYEMLETILNNDASPLRIALLDSNLGEDISILGYLNHMQECIFTIGLKGTNKESKDTLVALIDQELNKIVENGFDSDLIDSVLNSFVFHLKESILYTPKGSYLNHICSNLWNYNVDPFAILDFDNIISSIKEKLNQDKNYFSNLLKEILIDNKHKSIVTVYPDTEKNKRDQEYFNKILTERVKNKTQEEIEEIKRQEKETEIYQNTPDNPEELSKIPSINLSDLTDYFEYSGVKNDFIEIKGKKIEFISKEEASNGIIYIDLAIKIEEIKAEYLNYYPIFASDLISFGTNKTPYNELAKKIDNYGNIRSYIDFIQDYNGNNNAYIFIRIKTLDNINKILDILKEILLELKIEGNDKRIKNLLLEEKNNYKDMILRRGNSFISKRLSRYFSQEGIYSDAWAGIETMLFSFKSVSQIEQLKSSFTEFKNTLFNLNNVSIKVSGSNKDIAKTKELLPSLLNEFNTLESKTSNLLSPIDPVNFEVLNFPTNNSYVGYAFSGFTFKEEQWQAQILLSFIMRTGYLWNTVRMQGGAYGCGSSIDLLSGAFIFASYRDPNTLETLKHYKDSLIHYKDAHLPDLEKNIASLLASHNSPKSIANKTMMQFERHLKGFSDDMRKNNMDRIEKVKVKDIKAVSAELLERFDKGYTCILTGKEIVDRDLKDIDKIITKIE